MAEGQDKTVSVKFAVDVSSSDKLRRVIQAITDDVNKLVSATGKMGGAFGGFGGGGGAKVSSFSGSGGNGSVGTQMSQKTSGATGSIVDGLTKAVTQSSALFKGASAGAMGSFKIMGDSLRGMVSLSEREISKLEGSLSKLEKTYSKLKGRAGVGKGGFTDRAINANQSEYFSQVEQLSEANAARSAMNANLRKMNPTMGDRARSFFGIPKDGASFSSNPLAMIGSVAGSPAGMIMAGAGLAYKGLGMVTDFGSSNVGYALDNPMINLQNRADVGGVYGNMAVRARMGAVSQTMAWGRFLKNKGLEQVMGKEGAENLVAQIRLDNPAGLLQSGQAGKGLPTAALQKLGWGLGAAKKWLQGGNVVSSAGDLTGQEILQSKAFQRLPGETAKMVQQAISAEEASNPYINQIANDVYSGAFGDIAGINASRTSGNVIYDKKTGKPINTDYDLLRSKLQKNLWDPGQVFGMMGSLSGQLGRRLSGVGNSEKILDMNIGGFESSAGVFGAGSQFGGGQAGGDALTEVFQSRTGRSTRGLDIGAGSVIGSLVAGEMNGGRFTGGSGTGFAQVALNAAYGNGDTGQEMRWARGMASGLGSMDQIANGSLDPLQDAINTSAAMQVGGSMPWSTKQKLMSLDTASLMDIAANGTKSSSWYQLAGTGVTPDLVKQYVSARDKGNLVRVPDNALTSEQLEIKRGYGKEGIGFFSHFKKGKERDEKLAAYANVRQLGQRKGSTFQENELAVRLEASAAGLLGGATDLKGAHRTISKKSLPAAGAGAQGENTAGTGKTKAENEAAIKAGVGGTPGMVEPLQQTGQSMVKALGGQAEKEIMTAKQALNTALDLMVQMTRIETPAGNEKAAKAYYGGTGRAKKPSSRAEMPSVPGLD